MTEQLGEEGGRVGEERRGLLVSVRSADEAEEALAGGADVIDVKEPRHGALGAASSRVLREVVERVEGRAPVTAALGELVDESSSSSWVECVELFKVGLAQSDRSRWRDSLLALRERLVRQTGGAADLVAVAYADAATCGAPDPARVVEFACRERFPVVLVDTFTKDGSTLLDYVSPASLARWAEQIHETGGTFVTAGSVDASSVPKLVGAAADIIAVRGAATIGSRSERVCRERVAALAEQLASITESSCQRAARPCQRAARPCQSVAARLDGSVAAPRGRVRAT